MHKILALWAVPRSTSTAFEWMMRQRGDLDCLHEPFGEAWYQGEDPLWHRFKPGDEDHVRPDAGQRVGRTFRRVRKRGPVFLKDFPHYINHIWDAEFLVAFQPRLPDPRPGQNHHLDPRINAGPILHEGEVGFPEQRALFDLLLTALERQARRR